LSSAISIMLSGCGRCRNAEESEDEEAESWDVEHEKNDGGFCGRGCVRHDDDEEDQPADAEEWPVEADVWPRALARPDPSSGQDYNGYVGGVQGLRGMMPPPVSVDRLGTQLPVVAQYAQGGQYAQMAKSSQSTECQVASPAPYQQQPQRKAAKPQRSDVSGVEAAAPESMPTMVLPKESRGDSMPTATLGREPLKTAQFGAAPTQEALPTFNGLPQSTLPTQEAPPTKDSMPTFAGLPTAPVLGAAPLPTANFGESAMPTTQVGPAMGKSALPTAVFGSG
jgi:hypothetical protein